MASSRKDRDELRILVRQAILEMLEQGQPQSRSPSSEGSSPTPRSAPGSNDHEIHLTIRGSERSMRIVEQILESGSATLEVGQDATWGPRARVQASITHR